jgi:hypothetical protein
MTDRESLELNFGRWLLWGLLAVVGLIVIVVFFANLGRSDEPEASGSTPPGGGDQVEWSIALTEYTPTLGLITLKGDLPLGTPTETWQNDFMLARTVGGVGFTWNMDVNPEVPLPVFDIDQAGSCDELNTELNNWANEIGEAAGDARRAEASAFAQHALDTMLADECEPSQTS